MAGSLVFSLVLMSLLQLALVDGGFLVTTTCIAACVAGPCAGVAAGCKFTTLFFKGRALPE
jgi:hypothetical protein